MIEKPTSYLICCCKGTNNKLNQKYFGRKVDFFLCFRPKYNLKSNICIALISLCTFVFLIIIHLSCTLGSSFVFCELTVWGFNHWIRAETKNICKFSPKIRGQKARSLPPLSHPPSTSPSSQTWRWSCDEAPREGGITIRRNRHTTYATAPHPTWIEGGLRYLRHFE